MRRRDIIAILGTSVAACALPAAAQQSKRLPVVALVIGVAPLSELVGPDPANPAIRGFVHELRDRGWVEDRTVAIERRSSEGAPERAPAIFAELVARRVDVIALASGARWLHDAARAATRSVPIVAVFNDDPVASGMIANLAQPGGNLTVVTRTTGPEFYSKSLQLLQELAPRITRAAFLGTREVLDQSRGVSIPAGVTVLSVEVKVVQEYERAFATIRRERADALMVAGGPLNYSNGARLVAFAAESRLPAMHAYREAVEAGGLMSYGPSVVGQFRQLARLVGLILEGAKPGDIPTEQPKEFEWCFQRKLQVARQVSGTTATDQSAGVFESWLREAAEWRRQPARNDIP
jgi:putative ABC transport system substrate-binding protein